MSSSGKVDVEDDNLTSEERRQARRKAAVSDKFGGREARPAKPHRCNDRLEDMIQARQIQTLK